MSATPPLQCAGQPGAFSTLPPVFIQRKNSDPSVPQSGAGIVEFAIVAVPVLLLGLGAIESAQWLFTRQAVSLALLEAGRAGITQHASPEAMIDAFEHALLPLHASASRSLARNRLESALAQRRQRLGAAPWRIEILSPAEAAYRDFADPALLISRQSGRAAINNNYLHEQNLRHRATGRPEGRGPLSGVDIFQANTLALRLSYLHEPAVPGMKALLSMLGNSQGTYRQRAMAAGYLPMVREMAFIMQSHPVSWTMPENGKIVGPERPASNPPSAAAHCVGMWCLPQGPEPIAMAETPPAGPPPWPSGPAGLPNSSGTPPQPPGTLPPEPAPLPALDDCLGSDPSWGLTP